MKKKGRNMKKNILCILMCAFIFFGSAEPSSGIENAPPVDGSTTMDKGIQV